MRLEDESRTVNQWTVIEDMKLSDIKEKIEKYVGKAEQGKKIKAKKVKKVLDKLEEQEHRFQKEYAIADSDDVKKKLELEQKIVAAQIKKARNILKSLD